MSGGVDSAGRDGQEPAFWVTSSAYRGPGTLHYPAKFATEDSPRPLCGESITARRWAARDVETVTDPDENICQICQSMQSGAPDPRAHDKSGRSPRDVLEAAGFGGDGE